MGVIITCIACFFLYSKSKYFPQQWPEVKELASRDKFLTRALAYVLLVLAYFLFASSWGTFTGAIVWLVVVMFSYGIVITLVPVIADWRQNHS